MSASRDRARDCAFYFIDIPDVGYGCMRCSTLAAHLRRGLAKLILGASDENHRRAFGCET